LGSITYYNGGAWQGYLVAFLIETLIIEPALNPEAHMDAMTEGYLDFYRAMGVDV
jgi:hypothetical protein